MKNSICILIITFLVIIIAFLSFKYYKLSALLEPFRPVMLGFDSSTKGSTEDAANYLIESRQKYNDAIEGLENIKSNDKIDTKIIDRLESNSYYDVYKRYHANASVDTTQSILFEFPLIIKSLVTKYGSTALLDSNYWNNKGFFVYLINYGSTGHEGGKDKNQTSLVLQLAELDAATGDPTDWKVLDKQLFNFGDIRPPKKISNPQDSPEVR